LGIDRGFVIEEKPTVTRALTAASTHGKFVLMAFEGRNKFTLGFHQRTLDVYGITVHTGIEKG
jgi:hypothetical protein